MKTFASVAEMVAQLTANSQSIALEGYNHLIPFAFAHELIRAKRKDIHLLRLSADIVSDQLVGSGVVAKLTTGWHGNPIGGSLPRLDDARAHKWPRAVTFEDLSHPSMASAYAAGAARAPFALVTDLPLLALDEHKLLLRAIQDPFSGNIFHVIPPLNPQVAVLHAQRADTQGNIQFEGIVGAAKEVAYASASVLVTVEEVVDKLEPKLNSLVLPHDLIDAIAVVPRGAVPSYAYGLYERNVQAYSDWHEISSDRALFKRWLEEI